MSTLSMSIAAAVRFFEPFTAVLVEGGEGGVRREPWSFLRAEARVLRCSASVEVTLTFFLGGIVIYEAGAEEETKTNCFAVEGGR